MKIKNAIISILIIVLLGCASNPGAKKEESLNNDQSFRKVAFQEFFLTLPEKPLPLTIICGFNSTIHDQEFNEKNKVFIPGGFEAVGRLEANQDFRLILFAGIGDILYPYLFSYNQSGQKIDSVYLHISTCGEDPELGQSTWTIIDKDLTIQMTDTLRYYSFRESDDERILDSTQISTKTVIIDPSGRFRPQKKGRIN